MRWMFNLLYGATSWFLMFPLLFGLALLAGLVRALRSKSNKPRLLWAGVPMPSLPAASQALKSAGYNSQSIANQSYTTNFSGQFDIMLAPKTRYIKGLNTPFYLFRAVWCFGYSLFTRDIYHTFFTGGILGNTPLVTAENFLWRISGGKHIFFPYGQDGFVYSELPDDDWAKALKTTYPRTKEIDRKFKKRIASTSNKADCIVGCIVHTVNLPRVDVWPVLWYPPGFKQKLPKIKTGQTLSDTLKIAHASNHRDIKGTNIITGIVKQLKQNGYDIELDLIENVTTDVSRARLAKADVIIDQILMGYAMAALEGLWLGKPVISGFNDSPMYQPFYRRSYLNKCPILTATPQSLYGVLEKLCIHRSEIERLGLAGQKYLETYHSNKACCALFEAIYDKIWFGKNVDLSRMYEPH